QIVIELLHQLALRTPRVEGLQQQRAKQFLRRNRRPSRLGIEFFKLWRQRRQRLIDNLADRPQRMIYRHPRFTAHVAEQRLCLRIPSAHRTSPNISSRSRNYRQYLGHNLDLFPHPVNTPKQRRSTSSAISSTAGV